MLSARGKAVRVLIVRKWTWLLLASLLLGARSKGWASFIGFPTASDTQGLRSIGWMLSEVGVLPPRKGVR